MRRTCYIAELKSKHLEIEQLCLHGWINRRRDLGGLIFLELRDRSGIIQVQVAPDSPAFAQASSLRAEYVVQVQGSLQLRPEDQRKGGIGNFELLAKKIDILNTAKTTPFEITKGEQVSEELRLKYRYLDLRRVDMQRSLLIRSKTAAAINRFLDAEGFIQVETPILTKSTPEGARDFLVPSRLSPGEFYALPQSPQLFRQLLMISGVDRYYQLARCFRDEDLRADRQPDFTQLDIEMSFVTQEEVLELQERLLVYIFAEVLGVTLPRPFKRFTYHEVMDRYGSDKPDLRFELPLIEVTDIFQEGEFQAFANAHTVKMICAPELSRKEIDELTRIAKQNGALGLAWMKDAEGSFTGGISKFINERQAEVLRERADIKSGTLLFTAGEWKAAVSSLGAVRLVLRDMFELAKKGPQYHTSWVIEFPQFEFDEQNNSWTYMHHPFTAPTAKDIHLLGTEQQHHIRAQAYDLVINGYEVAGGSLRIHDAAVQAKMFEALGIDEKQAQEKFGFFLEALSYGTPPHGGIAWGFDRLVMILAGASSIREVIAFPKNNRGVDPMMGAPSTIEHEQLIELKLS